MLDREVEYLKMDATEEKLWWYRILHERVFKELIKNQVPLDAKILDAGCGTGGLMKFLQKRGFSNIHGVDLSEKAVEICSRKGLKVQKGSIDELDRLFSTDTFNVIISNDVLCYFKAEQHESVLIKMAAILGKQGLLLMNLPALSSFRGMHDISVGIQHRFTRKDIGNFKDLEVLELRSAVFWPFLLSPFIYLMRSWQRIKMKIRPELEITSDVALPPFLINQTFYFISRFETYISFLSAFGSSIFLTFIKRPE